MSVALLTNNPRWLDCAGFVWPLCELSNPRALMADSQSLEEWRCFLVEGSPLEVFLAGRRFLHYGWRLMHHPLYGNLRPHQQPYRSLLCRFEGHAPRAAGEPVRLMVDEWSIRLLEEALALYQNNPVLSPQQAPPALREACSILDFELMRLPLEQVGWPSVSVSAQGRGALDERPFTGGSLEAGTA
jgi:hypothetical protein